MTRSFALAAVLLALAACGGGRDHYTGFVEGEERVLRSEVTGRVLEVAYAEGDAVPAGAVVARLDDAAIAARLEAKRKALAVAEAEVRTQEERVALVAATWTRDLAARQAELAEAQAAADVAERTLRRERALVATGASTAQLLDDVRARRDRARAALTRAQELVGRAQAEERSIALARGELDTLGERRAQLAAEVTELEVTHAKYAIRAPAVATVVQTQFAWPGELAQPGTAILAVLDPRDKYVRVYVPVSDVARFRIGRKAEVELDSRPGERVPGEVSFVADQATFTPEKIETRGDRVGQVYRAKVRILEHVERFQPGTEGNVYLLEDDA